VFLLDAHQVVRRGEVGSLELLRERANALDCDIQEINLRHQSRSGGSPEFVDWVEWLLLLVPTDGKPVWKPLDNFELYLARTPLAMENYLKERVAEKHKARIAADFCWPWSEPNDDGTLPEDVIIGDWRRPWNSQAEDYLGEIPPAALWATDPAGFGQIGCVYSAQGFEYDYAGVIIGLDLMWRNGWVTNRACNKDRDQINARNFSLVIRNTYRVLATRGMRGVVLFSEDPSTMQMLEHELKVPVLGE
jgi:hypothetical protein